MWSVFGDFEIVPTFLASPENLIYASDSVKSRGMTSYRRYTDQVVGQYVCAAGIVNNYRCGGIVDDDFYYGLIFRGATVYVRGKLAQFRSDPGDSGGPVFGGNVILGIVSARDGNTRSAYGVIDQAMAALGIRPCLDSLCN